MNKRSNSSRRYQKTTKQSLSAIKRSLYIADSGVGLSFLY